MAVSPDELYQLTREFRHFSHFTTRFFDTFEEFADNLELLKHPETISVQQVQVLRNVMVEQRAQWEGYRDGLQRVTARLSAIETDTLDEFTAALNRPAAPAVQVDPEAATGCIAVAVGAVLTLGVVLGMWIAG